MNIILPLILMMSGSISTVLDKFNFNTNGVKLRELVTLNFLAMFGVVAIFMFLNGSQPLLFSVYKGVLLMGIIVMSFGQNLFEFKGLQTMDVYAREPINNVGPLLTTFIAYIFFPSERELKYIVAIVIGVIVLFWIKEIQFSLSLVKTGSFYVFIGVFLSAVLENINKFALLSLSPGYISLFRIGGVLVLSLIFLRPHLRAVPVQGSIFGLGSGVVSGVATLAKLFSIKYIGLNATILITLAGPTVTYILSYFVLRERVKRKQLVGSAIMLALVIITQYI